MIMNIIFQLLNILEAHSHFRALLLFIKLYLK